jgi:Fur family ferric uptake transcriptional regulator
MARDVICPNNRRGRKLDTSEELRIAGLKVTVPRLNVLELFRSRVIKHGTAEDIYRRLRNKNVSFGLATVYRVLMHLVQAGILVRNSFNSDATVFELDKGHHHDHLLCTGCGKVEEFTDLGIERRQEDLAKKRGFRLADYSLALYGKCAKCRQRESASPVSEAKGKPHIGRASRRVLRRTA